MLLPGSLKRHHSHTWVDNFGSLRMAPVCAVHACFMLTVWTGTGMPLQVTITIELQVMTEA